MALRPYPAFSSEAFSNLIDRARSGATTNAVAIHSAYEVIGYGLGQALPDGQPQVGAIECKDLASALEGHLEAHQTGKMHGLVPWSIVLPLVFELLQKLLAQLVPPTVP